MFVVCEKWVETWTDCYINPNPSSTIAALISHLGLELLNRGSLMTGVKLGLLYSNVWNHLSVYKKRRTLSIKCVYKSYIYSIYMYKEDLAVNNLQWLICHKTKPNQAIYIQYICIKRIWQWITYNGWYAIKPNQTKPYIFNIYV